MRAMVTNTLDEGKRERVIWVAEHPGELTEIARKCTVSVQFVSRVFHGLVNSEKYRVEKELAKLHAPGFDLKGPGYRSRTLEVPGSGE